MSNYGYRVIKTQWKENLIKQETKFLAIIKIIGIDDVGVVSSLADIISKNLEVNMKSITIESNEGTFEGTISVYVEDTQHLDLMMKKIQEKHPTMQINRVDINK
jgi:GTP pyrophosphokinase